MDSKISGDKHKKYLNLYASLNEDSVKHTEYWGIGIENETYLMLKKLVDISRSFYIMNQKRERYSVDYWKNYKRHQLQNTLANLPHLVKTPFYINGYLFQNADINGHHKTLHINPSYANSEFSGSTIDDYLKKKSPVVRELFEKNMIYDGDTFEFTTFDFYKTNVLSTIKELSYIKGKFLEEVNKHIYGKGIFNDEIVYPQFNYGFAQHLSNPSNIVTCNNGTYHINITLPTSLDSSGNIADPVKFNLVHSNAIRGIQWIEPLLIALYGSPDILHLLNPEYSGGSQRLTLSRYIGLGTYDTSVMEKGKLLDTFDYNKVPGYFTDLHSNSPYNPPKKIGYDFNYNKFTKHGIELRILDSFPEEYLESVMNFLVLICDYSISHTFPDPRLYPNWSKVVIDCLKNGSKASIGPEFYTILYDVFGITSCWSWFHLLFSSTTNKTPLDIMNKISANLYKYHRNGDVSKKLSPNMKPICFIDYNAIMKMNFKNIVTPTSKIKS